jgi:hypothetical protein
MRILFALTLTLILLLGFSGVVYAAEGFVSCGGPGEDPCTACDLLSLISNIANFVASRFAPIVGALLFVYGGIMMIVSVGDPGKFAKAKGIFWNTIIGLAIIYGAWLITNSLMQTLAGSGNFSDKWYEIECSVTAPGEGGSTGGGGTLPTEGGPSGETTPSGERLTAEDARDQLAANGIPVNKDECPAGVRYQDVPGGCTSVVGIRPEVVDGVTKLKNDCGCSVRVTGGTELGHSGGELSHENGYKVDLGRDPQLDSYIMDNYDYVGVRSDGARMYRDAETGAVYSREGDHWDIKGWDANYEG